MDKTKYLNKNKPDRHLQLISSNKTPLVVEQPLPCVTKNVNQREINFLTQAMMNRLWIPQSSTIVGLLDVGVSKDNIEELSKWINAQLSTGSNECASNDLQHLEKQFRDAVSHYYPEI